MRIVSLVPSITETLCDLELQENIVGRTKFCVSPKSLYPKVPTIGGTKDVNIEKIVSLKPTHILMNKEENTQACRTTLQEHPQLKNVIFYESFPKNIYDSIDMVEHLGQLFKKQNIVQQWKTQVEQLLTQCLNFKLSKKINSEKHFISTYAYFIWRNPWMVAGQNTYIAEMLKLVGFENVIQTGEHLLERYPSVEPTDPRLFKASHLFFSSEPFPFKQRHINEFISLNKNLLNEKCRLVDGQLLSWYGTRSLAGLKYLLTF